MSLFRFELRELSRKRRRSGAVGNSLNKALSHQRVLLAFTTYPTNLRVNDFSGLGPPEICPKRPLLSSRDNALGIAHSQNVPPNFLVVGRVKRPHQAVPDGEMSCVVAAEIAVVLVVMRDADEW